MWYPEHVSPPPAARDVDWALRARGLVQGFVRRIVDGALPTSCALCREPVAGDHGLCVPCWRKVRFLERPWCEVTGLPMRLDLGPGVLSAAALADPPPYRRARAAVVYDETAAALVGAFKYADRTDLAPLMVAWMRRVAAEMADVDMVVPVPLHRWRLLSRRFNQAAVLAAGIATHLDRPHRPLVLARRRATARQVGLSRQGRKANIAYAFAVPPRARRALAGRRVLLVDDVLTTGATVEAATRALLRGGARSVDVLVFARVVAGLEGSLYSGSHSPAPPLL